MIGLEEVYEIAERILLNGPDPVVRLRILRDVLQKPEDSQEVIEARRNVNHSKWVRVLTEEQWEDGSWGRFERWFLSQELLAGYPGWSILAADMMQWLWEARSPDGKWDFGPRGPNMLVLPMSESWRRRGARQNDWTTRVLLLLRSFYSSQSDSI